MICLNGVYNVKITDDNGGCVKSESYIVSQPDPLQILRIVLNPVVQAGMMVPHGFMQPVVMVVILYTWEPSGKTGDHVDNMPAFML